MSIEPSEWSSNMNSVCDQSTSGTSSASRAPAGPLRRLAPQLSRRDSGSDGDVEAVDHARQARSEHDPAEFRPPRLPYPLRRRPGDADESTTPRKTVAKRLKAMWPGHPIV